VVETFQMNFTQLVSDMYLLPSLQIFLFYLPTQFVHDLLTSRNYAGLNIPTLLCLFSLSLSVSLSLGKQASKSAFN